MLKFGYSWYSLSSDSHLEVGLFRVIVFSTRPMRLSEYLSIFVFHSRLLIGLDRGLQEQWILDGLLQWRT